MEKEMLVHLKLKEGKLETFMGWMQSDEGSRMQICLEKNMLVKLQTH